MLTTWPVVSTGWGVGFASAARAGERLGLEAGADQHAVARHVGRPAVRRADRGDEHDRDDGDRGDERDDEARAQQDAVAAVLLALRGPQLARLLARNASRVGGRAVCARRAVCHKPLFAAASAFARLGCLVDASRATHGVA
jgi:hypothetical protein